MKNRRERGGLLQGKGERPGRWGEGKSVKEEKNTFKLQRKTEVGGGGSYARCCQYDGAIGIRNFRGTPLPEMSIRLIGALGQSVGLEKGETRKTGRNTNTSAETQRIQKERRLQVLRV